MIALLLSLTPGNNAIAQGKIGRDVQSLRALCKMPPGHPDTLFCVAYIGGVGDTLDFVSGFSPKETPLARALGMCGKPSYGAKVQAFLNWSDKNPSKWKDSMFTGVASALMENFPCAP